MRRLGKPIFPLLSLSLLGLISLQGCHREPSRLPVSGEVTLNGTPVGPLSIVFYPIATDQPGGSLISIDGTFQAKDQQGLAPGQYHVTIEELQPVLEDYENRRAQHSSGLVDFRIPDKYRKPGWTSIEVQPDQTNHFLFELNSN